jgi:two-component system, NtrC family, sensor kinase
MAASPPTDSAYVEEKLDELTKELSRTKSELGEAREQQAATAEILAVISSSRMNLQRVFAEMAASAARLCDAYDAVILQIDGGPLRLVGHPHSCPRPVAHSQRNRHGACCLRGANDPGRRFAG